MRAWWVQWCAEHHVDAWTAGVDALTDAALDARLDSWSDLDVTLLVDAVGERTGLWQTPGWVTLRLALPL